MINFAKHYHQYYFSWLLLKLGVLSSLIFYLLPNVALPFCQFKPLFRFKVDHDITDRWFWNQPIFGI